MSGQKTVGMSVLCVAAAALVLAALILCVPSGEAVTAARNAYFLHEPPETPVFALRMYGLMLAVGALLAMLMVYRAAPGRAALRLIAFGSVTALIGARLLFCLVNLNIYMPEMGGFPAMLRLWDGGLSFFGALWGLLLAVWRFRRSKDIQRICGALALALPVMLFFFRLAEEWSNAGTGMSVEWGGLLTVAGRFGAKLNVRRIEMLCALAALGVAALDRIGRQAQGADRLAITCFMIGAMQILLESLRADRHMIWGFVKAEQIAGLLTAVGAAVYLLRKHRKAQAMAVFAGALVALAVFGLEKALDRLSVSAWLLYAVFALLILGYGWVSAKMVRQARERMAL